MEGLIEYKNTLQEQKAEMLKIENYKMVAEIEVRIDTVQRCIEILEA